MQGHARTAGKLYQQLEVGGKTYTLRPFMIGVCADMEAFILSRRDDPLVLATKACAQAPESLHAAIWEAAMKAACRARMVTAEEQAVFEQSLWGLAFKLWVCLRQDHGAEIDSPEAALRLLEEAGDERLQEIAAKVHVASGGADLGNSSGQPRNPEPTEPDPAVGPASTPSLPASSVGLPDKPTSVPCTSPAAC